MTMRFYFWAHLYTSALFAFSAGVRAGDAFMPFLAFLIAPMNCALVDLLVACTTRRFSPGGGATVTKLNISGAADPIVLRTYSVHKLRSPFQMGLFIAGLKLVKKIQQLESRATR